MVFFNGIICLHPATLFGVHQAMNRPIAHAPTWALLIGYPIFWLEMFFHHGSHTSWAAPLLFLGVCVVHVSHDLASRRIASFRLPDTTYHRLWLLLGLLLFIITFTASLLPPHLMQEGDALNYHLSIPRQHLILGSFRHIPWSAADLWPFPVQFALAPYWFCTSWPNKFPQFIFLVGLVAVSARITQTLTTKRAAPWAVAASILGSHGFGIQFGLAMLDLTTAYLVIAALDSLMAGDTALAMIELCFYTWAKSFLPIQMGLLLLGLLFIDVICRWKRARWTLAFSHDVFVPNVSWRKASRLFALMSLFIGGPFLVKSFRETGTPLFPFKAFQWNGRLGSHPESRAAVLQTEKLLLSARTAYGEERSFKAFVSHFWRIALPNRDVNNVFDYPIGLPYLLCLGPFIWMMGQSLLRRQFPLLPVMAVLFWALWWVGSQQSRWLYVPLVLIFISTLSNGDVSENRFLRLGLSVALLTTTFSVYRAHRADLWNLPHVPIRREDLRLWEDSRHLKPGERLQSATKEIAFAEAPVDVVADDPGWVMTFTPRPNAQPSR